VENILMMNFKWFIL